MQNNGLGLNVRINTFLEINILRKLISSIISEGSINSLLVRFHKFVFPNIRLLLLVKLIKTFEQKNSNN